MITSAKDEKLIELVNAGGGPEGLVVGVAVPVTEGVEEVVVATTEEVGACWAATAASRARVARRKKEVKDALAIMYEICRGAVREEVK